MQHCDGLPAPWDSSVFVEKKEEELEEEGSETGGRTERLHQQTSKMQGSV